LNTTTASKKVWAEYNSILKLGSEHDILIDVPKEKLEAATSQKIADIIMKNRNAQLDISPGYDGVYGEVLLEKKEQKKQLTAKHRQLGLDAFG
jgi:PHP family Zn ribbon phosphoesterase